MSRDAIIERIGRQLIFRSPSTGRFISIKRKNQQKPVSAKEPSGIRNGSLYSFRGQTVRALQTCNNGLRLVGFHNFLFGFAKDEELKKISRLRVEQYLGAVAL